MAVNRNLSKQLTRNWDAGQYPLFATGQDLTGLMESGRLRSEAEIFGHGSSDPLAIESLRSMKTMDAHDPGYDGEDYEGTLHDDIERNGVKNPVEIWVDDDGPPDLAEGHHRTFVTEEVEKRTGKDRWIPIDYDGLS